VGRAGVCLAAAPGGLTFYAFTTLPLRGHIWRGLYITGRFSGCALNGAKRGYALALTAIPTSTYGRRWLTRVVSGRC